jgi:uncharacterized protein YneF (UPF0154 family)
MNLILALLGGVVLIVALFICIFWLNMKNMCRKINSILEHLYAH